MGNEDAVWRDRHICAAGASGEQGLAKAFWQR